MKVNRYLGAAGVVGLASLTVFGATSSAHSAHIAKASCKASIAVEAPFATGPATQLGAEQLHFAELAVANDNKSLGIKVSLGQNDTGLNPSLATTRTNAIIASSAVAAVGPAGSQEVNAVGPLFARAGMAFISGSATNTALTTSGANSTFFRVVAPDAVQGPQDANYIVKKLKPKSVLLIDDEEAYSTGLVAVMTPILTNAGIKVNHQSYNGNDTGATLQSDLSSLVNSQLNSSETVVILPWQSAANAQLFGQTMQQQGKSATLFGTDGTDSPGQFTISGTYVSNFGPDISGNKSALDKSIVKGVTKYGPYGAFGLPTYAATDVEMRAIASVCKAGKKPTRSNVLAAVRKTNIPAAKNPLGLKISFKSDGDLKGGVFYLFHINSKGTYVSISSKA
jgi:branched-chain amino acid transport system substrate-binding protein